MENGKWRMVWPSANGATLAELYYTDLSVNSDYFANFSPQRSKKLYSFGVQRQLPVLDTADA